MHKLRWKIFATLAFVAIGVFLLYQFILDQQCITWRDYMKVRDGMTQSEIQKILGPPQNIYAKQDGGSRICWVGRKQGMISVEFGADGAMVRKYFVEEARDYTLSFFPRTRE